MNVHNLMEEIVIERIAALNDQIQKIHPAWFKSNSENYQLDEISYVLNKIPPKYVVSGRGVIHNIDALADNQLLADIDAIGLEGIRIVNTVPRKNQLNKKVTASHADGPRFNFPTFTGSVYDGTTFEPLSNASITLRSSNKEVQMQDQTWSNPCNTYKSTKGTYSFWAKSIKAEKNGEAKTFQFSLEIKAPGYENVHYVFTVPVVSEDIVNLSLNSTYSYKIQDLFLFSNEIQNPME